MEERLINLTIKQLSNFWTVTSDEKELLEKYINVAIDRSRHCIQNVNNKHFNGEINPLHSGQWCIFLYFLSNTLSSESHKELADKVYYLNKVMHSVDIYHEVNLPSVFFLEHPVGSVFGRAKYGEKFFAMQNCTVGGNVNKQSGQIDYPTIGNNVKMYSGSKIIGKAVIGDNVTIAANTYIKDAEIPDGATVFGQSPNLIIKTN